MDSPTYSPSDTIRHSPRSPRYSPNPSDDYIERKRQDLRLSRRKRASEDSDDQRSIYKSKKTRSKKGSSDKSEHEPSFNYNSPKAGTRSHSQTSTRKSDDGAAKQATPDRHHHHKSKGSEYEISNSRAGMWTSPEGDESDDGAGVLKSHSIGQPESNGIMQQHALPLIRAAWAGNFTVRGEIYEKIRGLNGCLSTKACRQARLAAEQLPETIRWEKLPKRRVWHKKFEQWGPSDGDIALFFFPSLAKHESDYESLLFDLIRDDLALRTTVMGLDLLLFTSVELPPLATRFQDKLYLWGVFNGNHHPRH